MIAVKKYKILLNSHLMTWLWHIKIFAGLKILLLGYRDILMHLKMFITLGLIHHFKCSSLFHHCTFRDYYPSFIGAHEIHISYFNNPYQLSSRLGFFLFVFHDHFYFSVKFFGFWNVFNVSCVIILGNWFAKFLVVTVSLNDMFKGKVHWWLKL